MPSGVFPGLILTPSLPLNFEYPAKIPIVTGSRTESQMSPPFSMMSSLLSRISSSPMRPAMAPATAAMGPTPASSEARYILATTSGTSSSLGTGVKDDKKSPCLSIWALN